ncbi:beta-mannosidase-like [Mizuhopecten yessoensis]|uniref:Beta-mannosidase n=1 Tax=Mizuhopecten yessoensis TaxID=6573 RepID=A0A210PXA8_MIZYE|nr:beta-mannosidase-like [Mizuhopecten yessoensis]OWF41123.1 Beta-mannosidase [Mizuhopecten yessoensis]
MASQNIGLLVVLTASLCCVCYGGVVTVNLNGNWTVRDENRGSSVIGQVPGNMYTALLGSAMIQDPYYRKNDELYRWISRDDWSYSRTFQVSTKMVGQNTLELVCDGLDTVAEVFINGKLVGESDNMFVQYTFNIKPAAVVGENTVKISFKSAVKYAAQQAQNADYVVPPECPVPNYRGDCHANMIRKMQSSFSWDWGPSFPTQGIWKNIYVQSFNHGVIQHVTTETILGSDNSWTLNTEVFMDIPDGQSTGGDLEVRLDGTTVTHRAPVSLTRENSSVSVSIAIPKSVPIKKWWPNGHGNQTMYKLYVFFTSSDGQEMSGKKVNVGFRTVEVVQDFVSANQSLGRTFYFKINGRPIFFKGSNWIPADVFLDRVTPSYVNELLQAAADVNMNVLRVWGGGVYETEEFYDTADRLGIMIWQDFMFGCAMYPVHKSFMDSVAMEIEHQVRRLKHHPSIVIWSGNNENEKALIQSWYNTNSNFTLYKSDYLTLYKGLMAPLVAREDSSRPFILSSPGNGVESQQEGGVAAEPWSELYGDIHEYKYLLPFYLDETYRIPRFSSEYGLQSYPSYDTLKKVYAPDDLTYWSDLNEYRQHHPAGNVELMAEISMLFSLPNKTDMKQRFKDSIYLTQITQAVGIKAETEHYRRWQNRLDESGRGNTMGAMYWQLNDIWQAPTWASLEYGGTWKMLHYFARHFFAPLLISPYLDGEDVCVYLIADHIPVVEHRHPDTQKLTFRPDYSTGLGKVHGLGLSGQLHVVMYSWHSFTPLHSWVQQYSLNETSELVFFKNTITLMTEADCNQGKNFCFLFFHLGDPNNEPVAWQPLTEYKNIIGLENAVTQVADVQQTSTDKQVYNVTIATDKISVFVWLDAHDVKGRFSDNGFLMISPKKAVQFFSSLPTDVATLRNSLTVQSLADVYH